MMHAEYEEITIKGKVYSCVINSITAELGSPCATAEVKLLCEVDKQQEETDIKWEELI